jgi:hypothetical protein
MNHARRASWSFLWLALAASVIVFLLAYWHSFHVLPAADDFSYINEIHRGSREGVAAFFTRSVTAQTYRPLTSVGLWAFGTMFGEHPTVGVRVLHLLSAVAFATVALPWIRALHLHRTGAAVAIAIMLLHPVLPQAVGSIDGFNSLASSAFLWLGAWFILLWRDHPLRAILASIVCFIIGAGFKEYAFALLPLSILTVICFWPRNRLLHGISFTLILGVLLVLAIGTRKYTVPPDPLAQGGWGYVARDPVSLAKNVIVNTALLASGTLFFGNSIWAYVNQSPATLAVVGLSILALIALTTWGIAQLTRGSSEPLPRRWITFLLLSFAAASFPAVLTNRVSEMYVPPLVLPLALLCGLAADGWARARPPRRALGAAAAVVLLISSILTIRAKIAGLVDVGRRADDQIRQILWFLPPDAQDKTVAVRYLASDRRPRDLYAVFRMPDHLLLVHRNVLHWPRPYRGLVLDAETVNSFAEVDPGKYDVTLGWDARQQKFVPIAR